MRKLLYLVLFQVIFFHSFSYGQGGTWTWMHGDIPPSYGTKGVPDPTNAPSGRYEPAYWSDLEGNFWMFGGLYSMAFNDLWKYDISSNTWTWINGPDCFTAPNPAGVFGVMGVPSPNNYPSARGYASNCWTDQNGDLWLYGGGDLTGTYFDDLWRYHIATNEWTWMGGNQGLGATANFGVMGVPAPSNNPGRLIEARTGWVDANNDLWMLGGDATGLSGVYSALWRYNIASGLWTWMKGDNTMNYSGNYGTYQVEAPSNQPPARASYTRWRDGDDNFYLFGGGGFSGTFNDVWKYSRATNNWTWVAGPNTINHPGAYPPQKCTFYENYFPRARMENQTPQYPMGCAKAFYTFGGFSGGNFNDLWVFESINYRWAWLSGTDIPDDPGNFGVQGVPSPTNLPPARNGHANWLDKDYNLWIFGGTVSLSPGWRNDMWRFVPDTACFNVANYVGTRLVRPDTAICPGDTVRMSFLKPAQISWSPNSFVSYNADTSELLFSPVTPTTYKVIRNAGWPCPEIDSVEFTIGTVSLNVPELHLSDTEICVNGPIKLTAPVSNLTSTMKFRWEPDSLISGDRFQQTITTKPKGIGLFIVTVTDSIGNCIGRVTDSMVVSFRSIELSEITPSQKIKYGDSIQLNASGALYYTWVPAGSLDYPNTSNPVAWPTKPTIYTVYGMDQEGCIDTGSVLIDIDYSEPVFIPSSFSPNGDGLNDVFRILGLKFQRLLEFRIYNRWGQEIFSTTDPAKGWDGRYKGTPQEPGVYQYLIRTGNPDGSLRVYKGNITLVR